MSVQSANFENLSSLAIDANTPDAISREMQKFGDGIINGIFSSARQNLFVSLRDLWINSDIVNKMEKELGQFDSFRDFIQTNTDLDASIISTETIRKLLNMFMVSSESILLRSYISYHKLDGKANFGLENEINRKTFYAMLLDLNFSQMVEDYNKFLNQQSQALAWLQWEIKWDKQG